MWFLVGFNGCVGKLYGNSLLLDLRSASVVPVSQCRGATTFLDHCVVTLDVDILFSVLVAVTCMKAFGSMVKLDATSKFLVLRRVCKGEVLCVKRYGFFYPIRQDVPFPDGYSRVSKGGRILSREVENRCV